MIHSEHHGPEIPRRIRTHRFSAGDGCAGAQIARFWRMFLPAQEYGIVSYLRTRSQDARFITGLRFSARPVRIRRQTLLNDLTSPMTTAQPMRAALDRPGSWVAAIQVPRDDSRSSSLFQRDIWPGKLTGMISAQDHAARAKLLGDATDVLPKQFKARELASLTATQKIEIPVRDAIASYMRRRIQDDGYAVITELPVIEAGKRTRRDLAVLDGNGVVVLELEAKALYSFDVTNEGRRRDSRGIRPRDLFSDRAKDVERLLPSAKAGEACFLLSLVTHLGAYVPPELTEIKYTQGHNRELGYYHGSPKALHEAAVERWPKDLKEFGPLAHHVNHELGKFRGVPILLDCYLVGPIPAKRTRRSPKSRG